MCKDIQKTETSLFQYSRASKNVSLYHYGVHPSLYFARVRCDFSRLVLGQGSRGDKTIYFFSKQFDINSKYANEKAS